MAKNTKKLMLVTGSPRSGTKHVALVLRRAGMKIKHEKVDEHGVVSCIFMGYGSKAGDVPYQSIPKAFPSTHPGGEYANQFEFEHVIHLVRDPLKTIGSIRDAIMTGYKTWAEMALGQPKGKGFRGDLPWAMNHWLLANTLVAKSSTLRLRVEDLTAQYPKLRKLLGTDVLKKEQCPEVTKTTNRSLRAVMKFGQKAAQVYDAITYPTWADLDAADAKLANAIRKLSRRYGYATDD